MFGSRLLEADQLDGRRRPPLQMQRPKQEAPACGRLIAVENHRQDFRVAMPAQNQIAMVPGAAGERDVRSKRRLALNWGQGIFEVGDEEVDRCAMARRQRLRLSRPVARP